MGIGTVLVSIAAANPARANVPCKDLNIFKNGDKCFVDVPIYLRVKDKPDLISFDQQYEPDANFLILDHTVDVKGRLGDTTGITTTKIQANSSTQTIENYEQTQKDLNEFFLKKKTEFAAKGINLSALQEIENRAKEEFKYTSQFFKSYSSNNYGLRMTGSARAQWRKILNQRIYTSGGLLDAVVRIYQIYVGTPQDLNSVVEKYKQEVKALEAKAPLNPTRPSNPLPTDLGVLNSAVSLEAKAALNPTPPSNPTPTDTEVLNSAVSFDGTNDVKIPDNENLNFDTGDVTISAWVKTTINSGIQAILDKRVETTGPIQGYHLANYNGNLLLQLADGVADSAGNTWTNYLSNVSIADGNWHHVAVTVDRDQPDGGHWYLDGVEVGQRFNPTNRSGSLSNSKELVIGNRSDNPGWSGFLNGELAHVQLAKRVLSPQEIQALAANRP